MNTLWSSYRHRGFRKVHGWMQSPVLELVEALTLKQRELGVRGAVAEIGVHHGLLFIGMHLLRDQSSKSLAIDLFEDQESNVDSSGQGDRSRFSSNLNRHAGGTDSVNVLQADSTQLSAADILTHAGSSIRLFSVDGGHTAKIVEHDMRLAEESLTEGGIVIADDMYNYQWPGVAEGTFRYLEFRPKLVPFAVGFNKVLFTTKPYAHGYRSVLEQMAGKKQIAVKTSELHSHSVIVLIPQSRRQKIRSRLSKSPVARKAYKYVKAKKWRSK